MIKGSCSTGLGNGLMLSALVDTGDSSVVEGELNRRGELDLGD